MTEESLDDIQGKTRDELLKSCQEYLDVYQKLEGFIRNLEEKLPYFKDDQPKISSLIQEYREIRGQLSELSSELEMFHSLEEDERAMVFLMGGQDLAHAKKFTMELPLKLVDTEHGRQLVGDLSF